MNRTSVGMVLAVWAGAHAAWAGEPERLKGTLTVRYQGVVRGDLAVVGNTLGHDAQGSPVPVVGTVGPAGTNTADSAPDLFWRSNSPASGAAQALLTVTASTARSQANLVLPSGATVAYARLYWAGKSAGGTADQTAEVARQGAGGFTQTVTADGGSVLSDGRYQSTADITALVQSAGAGPYEIGGVECVELANLLDDGVFAGWSMAVVYTRPGDVEREVVVGDAGLQEVTPTDSKSFLIARMNAVLAPVSSVLTVVAYDGDLTAGDSLRVNGQLVSDALNPASNVFNSTRTRQGAAVSVAGDLPQTTGQPVSMAGMDLDSFDVTALVDSVGADLLLATTSDTYVLGWVGLSAPGLTPVCAADYNHSGGLSVQDIFDFLAGYFANDLAADFNQSGSLTVQDIFDFLAAYFTGC